MKALVQRVRQARVTVNGQVVGAIDQGILVFLGVAQTDSEKVACRLLDKVLNYRLFEDLSGKMNLSVRDMGGGVLIVSQFTLVADTRKGLRPSFSSAAVPEAGRRLYDRFVAMARERHTVVETGQFGANMQVELVNDGPVTFLLEVN